MNRFSGDFHNRNKFCLWICSAFTEDYGETTSEEKTYDSNKNIFNSFHAMKNLNLQNSVFVKLTKLAMTRFFTAHTRWNQDVLWWIWHRVKVGILPLQIRLSREPPTLTRYRKQPLIRVCWETVCLWLYPHWAMLRWCLILRRRYFQPSTCKKLKLLFRRLL